MKLDDIAPVNADKLNAKMQAMLGWNIKLEGLDAKKAATMLESVDRKLSAVRNSSKLHESEKDANYTGMLMARRVLESFVAEKAQSPYAIGMASAMKQTGDKPPLKKSTITKDTRLPRAYRRTKALNLL